MNSEKSGQKKVTTPKQTSGGGYVFEDRVVAYYLIWMLSSQHPFSKTHGPINRIDCQVQGDGWLFDDLLLTLKGEDQIHHYALSIKSNVQFSTTSAPQDFVETAWALFLDEESEVFNRESDMMGLICSLHPNPPKSAIQSLLRKAYEQSPEQLASRLKVSGYASEVERNLFDSFACSEKLTEKYDSEKPNTGEILKRIIVQELDFETTESADRAMMIYIGRNLLTNGSVENGIKLWNELCQIAQRLRISGGGIRREDLLVELKNHFEFRDFPDFSSDWYRLSNWFVDELEAIPDHLGGIIQIERQAQVDELLTNLHDNSFTALIGPSGSGKSVVGKWTSAEFAKYANILWLRGERLRSGYIETFAGHHGLTHPLNEVLANNRHATGLIVVDSSERLIEEDDFRELAQLLKICKLDESGCIWRLLLICQADEWERVQLGVFRQFGVPMGWNIVRIASPTFERFHPLWNVFPSLQNLALRPHLQNFMCNMKVLDIFAAAIQTDPDFPNRSWVGESDLITWWWGSIIRRGNHGARRSAFLTRIAEREADYGRFELAETDFSNSDLNLVSDMRGIIKQDMRSTISFSHDLIADWSRLQAIISHEGDLREYLRDRLTNPHWHKAVRLYGITLLERDNTGESWKRIFDENPDIRNSFLESVVFAGNSHQLLKAIWPILIKEDGKLLVDLLNRFLYVATFPNPQYLMLAKSIEVTDVEASTWERLPLWMYWLGMLQFLVLNAEEAIRYAKSEIARIAYTWLRYTPNDWPGREDAAKLALSVGWHVFRNHRCYQYYLSSGRDGVLPYIAALEAYCDNTDDVREFALKACSRIVPTEEDGDAFEEYSPPGSVTISYSHIYGGERITPEPWPVGPLYRVDDAFRAACLEYGALRVIMEQDPELASEIILALLVEARSPLMDSEIDFGLLNIDKKLGIVDHNLFYPRFFTKGPFLPFLYNNPEFALKTIIHLVDFATKRWIEANYTEDNTQLILKLPYKFGTKDFIGDSQVFDWYHALIGSDVITSALMAIEKWFYQLIDKDEPVEEWILFILDESCSLAFLGMLTEVGRYQPSLFTRSLSSLLFVHDFYYFEQLYIVQGGHSFGTPLLNQGEWFWNLANEWDTMEHRSIRMLDIAANLFSTNQKFRADLLNAREKWQETLDTKSSEQRAYIENLVSWFDPRNWKERELPDGSVEFVFYEPKSSHSEPEHIEAQIWQFSQRRQKESRRRIDENMPIREDNIVDFLSKAKELSDLKRDDLKQNEYEYIAEAMCGTIAVLYKLHRSWLRDNPQEEKWCSEKLISFIDNSPSGSTWIEFVCDVLPILWSEASNNSKWRKYIAKLVVTGRYDVTYLLIRNSFEVREKLGSEFWKLVNFVLDWATVLHEIRRAQYSKTKINIAKLQRKTTQKFARGKYVSELLPWGEVSINNGKLWSYWNHPRYINNRKVSIYYIAPRIDIELIHHTFKNVFLPEQAIDKDERSTFLGFWEQALFSCLTRTKYFDKDGVELENEKIEAGFPQDYDNWVFENLSIVITQMEKGENSERFWLPILDLGPNADHWIERFLYYWFLKAKSIASLSQFTMHWRLMIEFCLSSEKWVNPNVPLAYHQSSLWLRLIGISSVVGDFWVEDDQDTIKAMESCFVEIAPRVLRNRDNSRKLVSWLTKSSSKPIHLKMLIPLGEAAAKASDYWWDDRRLITTISSYLNILWNESSKEIMTDKILKKNFETLLHSVSTRNEPQALELQKRISTR
jgi:hypothetical protein